MGTEATWELEGGKLNLSAFLSLIKVFLQGKFKF